MMELFSVVFPEIGFIVQFSSFEQHKEEPGPAPKRQGPSVSCQKPTGHAQKQLQCGREIICIQVSICPEV